MKTTHRNTFTTIRTEGAILPPDLLQRISDGASGLEGLQPGDYHLFEGEKLNESINRSWNRLIGAWENFKQAQEKVFEGQPGTTETRQRWLLPLFQELDYGRLQTSTAFNIEGKSYPISHGWERAPIHLLGFNIDLGKRTPGVAGAATTSPHSMVQEFLNRSDDHLWAFLSNGLQLRVLRDNVSLTRQAYVEFDLEAMMEGEVYADFVLLWLLCHQSRVEGEKPEEFWLEQWSRQAQEQGTRALEQLRKGVEEAISSLGSGFLRAGNSKLRADLRSGTLSPQDYYRQLLRMVYRLIFLFVAEDRNLLFPPKSAPLAKERYRDYYSTQRLRRLAERSRGLRHADLYYVLRLVTEKLSSMTGSPELALPALGGFLFSTNATPDLDAADLPNQNLLDAVRALAYTVDGRTLRPVDYKNLGPEELGSVYESLLELHPEMNVDAGTFNLTSASGHERKTTGSYYTPSSLIQVLLDSALDPVIAERLKSAGASPEAREAAILDLKVCDPAVGSGHFLIAAAHRLARHLAGIRTGDDEPSPDATRAALRDVIGNCLYGVDLNPMAVELCKVSLWMEALEPGKPLSFLDAHIKCGNSLVGVGPDLDISEIPDNAFKPAFGDDKKTATALRKRNKREREGQLGFRFDETLIKDQEDLSQWLAQQAKTLEDMPEDAAIQVQAKVRAYQSLISDSQYLSQRLEYDLWTAAFFWQIPEDDAEKMLAPSQQELTRLRSGKDLDVELTRRVQEIAENQNFFHWVFEFPSVYGDDNQGFDVFLGNPPWERIKLQEKEWFAGKDDDVFKARTAAQRKKIIEALNVSNASLFQQFCNDASYSENLSGYFRNSNRYSYGAVGDINTFSLFAEVFLCYKSASGLSGFIAPTSLISDYTYRDFFNFINENQLIRRVVDFSNTNGIFPQVDRNQKFCLLSIGKGEKASLYSFGLDEYSQANLRENSMEISADTINLVNPNTKTCPAFQSTKDAKIITSIYLKTPVLENNNVDYWELDMWSMFHMSNDSDLFLAEENINKDDNKFYGNREEISQLYEGKMIQHFDHRYAHARPPREEGGTRGVGKKLTSIEKENPSILPNTRFLVSEEMVIERAKGHKWFIGYREVAGAVANIRSMTATILPLTGVGHKVLLLGSRNEITRKIIGGLLANLNSLVYDYVLRQKLTGTSLSFYIIKQLPTLPPEKYGIKCPWDKDVTLLEWLTSRVIELVYTAWDLSEFAAELGYMGPPLRWNSARRHVIRCELDAMFFYLYGCDKKTVEHILSQFTILERRELSLYSEFRTQRLVIEVWERMLQAIEENGKYVPMTDPPPADPRVSHPNRDGSVYEGPGLVIDTGQLVESREPRAVKEEQAEYEIPAEEEKVVDTSDYGLYKCQGCGTMVMGFAKDEHLKDVHGGESQGFEGV
jgi:hypothetical protein